MLDVNKRQQKIEGPIEEKEEPIQEEEQGRETPKYVPSARDNDEETKTVAKGLFNKMFEIEEEYEEPEETEPVMVRNEDNYLFESNGEENKLVVSPYNEIEKYNIEIRDEDDNVVHIIPNIKGRYMARMNFIKGKYKVHVRSNSNMTALIKLS